MMNSPLFILSLYSEIVRAFVTELVSHCTVRVVYLSLELGTKRVHSTFFPDSHHSAGADAWCGPRRRVARTVTAQRHEPGPFSTRRSVMNRAAGRLIFFDFPGRRHVVTSFGSGCLPHRQH